MASKLDRIIVIDVESTCWDSEPPPGQRSEIIEIGVCVLDVQSGERVDKRSILVQPEHSEVSAYCTELTSLTPRKVRDGMTFERACHILERKFKTHERVWASYGNYDRRQFERQCAERGVRYPFNATHLNVKTMLALMHGLSREVGLKHALDLLHIPLYGRHHRGVDDAWNTALILSRLLLERRPVIES